MGEQEKQNRYTRSVVKITLIVLNSCLGALFFGYSIGVFSLSQKTLFNVIQVEESKTDLFKALITASVPFGAIFGSFYSGNVLQILSRKNSLIAADILGIISCGLSQITNIYVLLISRVLTGICTGLNSGIIPIYIAEMSPTDVRGKMGTLFNSTVAIGIILSSLFGQFFQEDGSDSPKGYWRIVYLFPLVLCVIRSLVLLLVFNFETPLYYFLKGQGDEGQQAISNFIKPEYIVETTTQIKKQSEDKKQQKDTYADMFSKKYRWRVFIGCMLQFFQQFSGINAVIMYSGTIFEQMVDNYTIQNLMSLISNTTLLIASLLSSLFVNSLGRQKILIGGSFLCALFQIALCILSIINKVQYFQVVLIFLYYLSFNFSLGPIVWLYNSEILPEKGNSIATMTNWIGATIIVVVLPFLKLKYLFGFYGIVCIFAAIFSRLYVKETKGLNQQQINQMFMENQIHLSNQSESYNEYVKE